MRRTQGKKVAFFLLVSCVRSFMFVPALGMVAGAVALWLETPHGFQHSHIECCWLHTKMGPSQVGDVITPPGPWTTSGPLSRGRSQQGPNRAQRFQQWHPRWLCCDCLCNSYRLWRGDNLVGSVPSKKILHWANDCFVAHSKRLQSRNHADTQSVKRSQCWKGYAMHIYRIEVSTHCQYCRFIRVVSSLPE